MKKYLKCILIIFFCINLPNYLSANIDNIFGVKLFDNVNKYAKIEKGVTKSFLPNNIYTFIDKDLNIERDPTFDRYYLRTNDKYQIINISGSRILSVNKNNFTNKCPEKKREFITQLTSSLNIKPNNFKSNYSKMSERHGKTIRFLWDASDYIYKDDGKRFVLSVYCVYKNFNNQLISTINVNWLTEDYYKKYVLTRTKQIRKFNDKFILNNLFDEKL